MNLFEKLLGHNSNNITQEELLEQSQKICLLLYKEYNNFDCKKDYFCVYKELHDSLDCKYRSMFEKILDNSAKLIIDEICENCGNLLEIKVEFEPIKNSSSKNRRLFCEGKDMAISIIKVYSLSLKKEASILDYINEYIPSKKSYHEIDLIIWYFLISIMSISNSISNKEGVKTE